MTPKEQRLYNWQKVYNSIPAPKEKPCKHCRLEGQCSSICPARAKWRDVCMEKIRRNGNANTNRQAGAV